MRAREKWNMERDKETHGQVYGARDDLRGDS